MRPGNDRLARLARATTAAFLGTVILAPILIFVFSSLLPWQAVLRGRFDWSDLGLANYIVLAARIPVGPMLRDTSLIALASSLLALLVAVPSALLTARVRGALSTGLYGVALTLWLVPPVALSLQVYFWFQSLGLYDTHGGLILLYGVVNATLVLILLSPVIDTLPRSLDEMAALDRLSGTAVLWRVYLPLLAAPVAAIGAWAYLRSWSELLFASLLTDVHVTVLSTALLRLTSGSRVEWGQLAALGTIGLIPLPLFLLLIVMLLRKRRWLRQRDAA